MDSPWWNVMSNTIYKNRKKKGKKNYINEISQISKFGGRRVKSRWIFIILVCSSCSNKSTWYCAPGSWINHAESLTVPRAVGSWKNSSYKWVCLYHRPLFLSFLDLLNINSFFTFSALITLGHSETQSIYK